ILKIKSQGLLRITQASRYTALAIFPAPSTIIGRTQREGISIPVASTTTGLVSVCTEANTVRGLPWVKRVIPARPNCGNGIACALVIHIPRAVNRTFGGEYSSPVYSLRGIVSDIDIGAIACAPVSERAYTNRQVSA